MQIKLLVALCCLGGSIERDRLVALLWERPAKGTRETLRSHVSRIRKQVTAAGGYPDRVLATVSPGSGRTVYGLAEGIQCDSDVFVAQAREGADALAFGDYQRASDVLGAALGRWGRVTRYDQFLAEVADCSFAVQTRSSLWEARKDAMVDKARADIALGLHRRAAADLPGLAAEWPDDGEVAKLLATVLYSTGKPVDAAEACKNAAARARDLGIDDQPFLNLHQAILNGSLPSSGFIPAA